MRSCSIRGVVRHRLAWLVLILCSWRVAAAQDQPAPKTDSVEAAALNTILGRWGKKASLEWNISGELCRGFASAEIDWDYYPTINPFIKCDCSFSNNTLCHITKLYVILYCLVFTVVQHIPLDAMPDRIYAKKHERSLIISVSKALKNHNSLYPKFGTCCIKTELASNRLSGPLPKELGNLTNLLSLGINLNNFSGELPEEVGNMTKLQQLYIYSSGFSGPFPSTISKLKNLKLLKASDNEFTGKLLDYMGSLTKLEEL
uniref:Leucine-rich repeat-containing N-terminal plant-type domain-containing protein n=1 Tax=Oryza glumipatula TaxID=40148 RepID=A0A0D9ZHD1_9ORYZ